MKKVTTTTIFALFLVGVFSTIGIGLTLSAKAKPFPANNENACQRAGGQFSRDTTTNPPTNMCVVTKSETTTTKTGPQGKFTRTETVTTTTTFTKQGGKESTSTQTQSTSVRCTNPQGKEVPADNPNCQSQ
jgi:hypothetical protein